MTSMTTFYRDYFWEKGTPKGLEKVEQSHPISYKIVSDAYHKRISIEEYSHGKFSRLNYDSFLLDFRKLNPQEQLAWEREMIVDSEKKRECLIRDINDRFILKEVLSFKEGLCTSCHFFSPHGMAIGHQKIFYEQLGDSFNGVILYDLLQKQVVKKTYSIDENCEFTNLLEEIC